MVYYAGGRYVGLPPEQVSLEELTAYARGRDAEFIAGYSRILRRMVSDFEAQRDRRLRVIKAFKPSYTGSRDDGDEFVVYRVVD